MLADFQDHLVMSLANENIQRYAKWQIESQVTLVMIQPFIMQN